ncbi:MAG: DUF4097 family beta strand repeat protein [Acidimicrobiia bacterium]|jgi:DUF4097 and DUF4098 domain-containing protein YvlB|nr:DUF4097 family beta strand repeat protein [Acidimicrobiia bacterium]MBA3983006.1 DUF4097 family beta strand repeat protein [Acidimicrobiia bacterium]MDQ3390287.1 DUF4097 domain-containing protein [Actinomycetota bacterium]
MTTFPTPTPPRLNVEFGAGSIAISTGDVSETTIDLQPRRDSESARQLVEATTIEQHGDEIIVKVPRRSGGWLGRFNDLVLRVTAPDGTALSVHSGSADITATGNFGTTTVGTGSGDVMLGHLLDSARLGAGSGDLRIDAVDRDLDVKSGSGNVEIGAVAGSASVLSGSGDVRLGSGGSAVVVKTGSGNVYVGEAAEEISAKTGSGDVRIESIRAGDIKVRAASGDISAGIVNGTAVWLDVNTVSGKVRNDLDATDAPSDGDDRVRLQLETVSGNIDVARV